MFMKDGLDGKKNARQIRECHEKNALIQSFEKSPHLMGLTDYPYVYFKQGYPYVPPFPF